MTQRFQNSELTYTTSLSNTLSILKDYLTTKRQEATPHASIPVLPITTSDLENTTESVYRLGHSSLLLVSSGKRILFDPVFGERASPFKHFGPKRFHQPPIALTDLPSIDLVLLSHDHFDHLDEPTIRAIHPKVTQFFVPLNVGERLRKWGVPTDKIREFEWWQSQSIDGFTLTFTPAQHFSGRSLFDKDTTLWGGWAIKTPNHNLFFSGDSGYFGGFKTIGEKLGPFDLTFIETGAYNARWAKIHMFPEQSLQAHLDLQGKVMMPIHNSTFDLALHDWHEPLNRIFALAEQQRVNLSLPKMGEPIALFSPHLPQKWW